MTIQSFKERPVLLKRGGDKYLLDCRGHNRWMEIALCFLPEDLVEDGEERFLFTSTAFRDGCRIARALCETREIILISERVLPGNEVRPNAEEYTHDKARYFIFVVLHEVAHAIMKHKSPLLDSLSPKESDHQECEANAMAMKWFNDCAAEGGFPPITEAEVSEAQEGTRQIAERQVSGP